MQCYNAGRIHLVPSQRRIRLHDVGGEAVLSVILEACIYLTEGLWPPSTSGLPSLNYAAVALVDRTGRPATAVAAGSSNLSVRRAPGCQFRKVPEGRAKGPG